MRSPVDNPEISVVVPMYREAENLRTVIRTIHAHLVKLDPGYELIVIDDGSPDDTWNQVVQATRECPALRGLRLSRNFGKEHAVCAGLEAATGRAVVVMDGDLQHPPELIEQMVTIWREGKADIVEAVKDDRGRESLRAKLCATAFYTGLKRLSGFDLSNASDFKLMDRKVVDAWSRLRERSLFFRGMIAWLGFRKAQVHFQVPDRVGGRSQWSIVALIRLALTAVTAFSSVLLQLVTLFGLAFLLLAVIVGSYTLYEKFFDYPVDGFTTIIILLLIMGSLLMISLGLIGLYLARIYDEVKQRPRYLLSESIAARSAVRVTSADMSPDVEGAQAHR